MSKGESRGSRIDKKLALMCRGGGFSAAYIINEEGLVVGGMSKQYDQMMMSAMAALVQDVIDRSESLLGFTKTDEISLVDNDKNRLVCRPFVVGKEDPQTFILTIIAKINQTYRMMTNRIIKEIKVMWDEMYS